ncbi:MAG TPA: glycosyltransferase family 4 protein [Rhizomicrobium sp.]|nr:glycosyltransferase family 4 protein [Rhizomicrobium sp.]
MKPRVAILACLSANGEQGGAERFFPGLRDALSNAGMAAYLLEIYNDERDFEHVKKSYLRFYDLNLDAYDGIVSAKAPSFVARHRNHVCYLMHTIRVFYDMFESSFPRPTRENLEQRRLVHALDTAALQLPRRLFAIGEEVAERLQHFNGLHADVVRHPTSMRGLHEGRFDYFLLPGRLHRWKRAQLAIEAMRFVTAPVDLIVVGTGEDEAEFRSAASGDRRVQFLGRISDSRLADLYANAMAVLFTPKSEDLGLVTLEAFQSAKPVITCIDSGEPARIVKDGVSGYVCRPEPAQIGAAMEHLAHNPERAREMGRAGRLAIGEITWERVAGTLRNALGFGEAATAG